MTAQPTNEVVSVIGMAYATLNDKYQIQVRHDKYRIQVRQS